MLQKHRHVRKRQKLSSPVWLIGLTDVVRKLARRTGSRTSASPGRPPPTFPAGRPAIANGNEGKRRLVTDWSRTYFTCLSLYVMTFLAIVFNAWIRYRNMWNSNIAVSWIVLGTKQVVTVGTVVLLPMALCLVASRPALSGQALVMMEVRCSGQQG